MSKNKYCYAIVDKENGKLLTSNFCFLPIYTDNKMAKDAVKNFNGFIIQPILLEDLERFLIHPKLINRPK